MLSKTTLIQKWVVPGTMITDLRLSQALARSEYTLLTRTHSLKTFSKCQLPNDIESKQVEPLAQVYASFLLSYSSDLSTEVVYNFRNQVFLLFERTV